MALGLSLCCPPAVKKRWPHALAPRSPPCFSLNLCFALAMSGLLALGSVPRSLPSVCVPGESSDGWGHSAKEGPAPRHGRTAGLCGQLEAASASLPPRPWLLLSHWPVCSGEMRWPVPTVRAVGAWPAFPPTPSHAEADATGPGSCVPHLLVSGDSQGNLVPTFAVTLTRSL